MRCNGDLFSVFKLVQIYSQSSESFPQSPHGLGGVYILCDEELNRQL